MTAAGARRSFEAHRDSVYVWAFRLLANHHDALDVTQEVFVKWWRAGMQGVPPENPVGWLRRVTINQAIDAARSASRSVTVRHSISEAEGPADACVERRELAATITEAMETLPERQRAVLFAKVYDGCTFAEIAGQMDLALPTVKTHYLRAIRSLRPKLIEAGLMPGDSHAMQ